MSEPFDNPPECQVPPGKWRVVELEIDGRHPLRMIGDYDTFYDASDALQHAKWPHRYVLYDDLGRQLVSVTPGKGNQPLAGAES
jgi:hypothetical protein